MYGSTGNTYNLLIRFIHVKWFWTRLSSGARNGFPGTPCLWERGEMRMHRAGRNFVLLLTLSNRHIDHIVSFKIGAILMHRNFNVALWIIRPLLRTNMYQACNDIEVTRMGLKYALIVLWLFRNSLGHVSSWARRFSTCPWPVRSFIIVRHVLKPSPLPRKENKIQVNIFLILTSIWSKCATQNRLFKSKDHN